MGRAPEGKHERQTEPSVGSNRAPHTTPFVAYFVFGIVNLVYGIVKFLFGIVNLVFKLQQGTAYNTSLERVVYLIFVK